MLRGDPGRLRPSGDRPRVSTFSLMLRIVDRRVQRLLFVCSTIIINLPTVRRLGAQSEQVQLHNTCPEKGWNSDDWVANHSLRE